ncbi:type II toxin-antitoxin system ParD family antitoxin [uncultured Sphingomonas sp.]|uniref:type II toxin-antitoxin system ParD family antitoxin n=1 Tax=uncultured Sphingomonas sp. TaxID=158754 RepID=UPI0025FAA982|nr:type II toxin-antitoxin system ParD family antitoxin [uncultured Sphingomonas sp.]
MMAQRQSRNVSLTPELESFITDSLATGDYGNASEVVRTALKMLRDRPAAREMLRPWPVGGGETGAMIRAADWTRHALGPVEGWSTALRVTVANVVNSPVPKVLMWGRDGILLYNDAYREIAGARHPEAMGCMVAAVFPEIADWNAAIIARGLSGEVVSFRDQPLTLNRDGRATELFFDLFYTPVTETDGSVGGVLCTVIDNTTRLTLERRLAASEAELRTVTDALPLLVSFIDRDLVYRYANQHYYEWFAIDAGKVIGCHTRDVIGAENFELRRPLMERALAGETIVQDSMIRHGDGSWRRADIRYLPRRDADGVVVGFQVIVLDIEDRVRREEALNASNARFRAAMEAMHGVLWTNDAAGRMVGEQLGWAMLTGQTPEQYQGYGWADAVHPDDAQPTLAAWQKAVASKSTFVFEHRVRRHCGTWRTFSIRAVPRIDAQGEIAEWVGVHTDITHQRAAEAALRDHAQQLERQVRHRERAEEQLRQLNETLETRVIAEIASRHAAERKLAQSQKMETVGKLTGGVAHDFNNLLQVVSGNLQLLQKDIAGNERAETRVANALAGVSRGSRLASQLLAFGRRQALEPKVVNVTRFVRGMDDMLRRAIGEGIEVETIFGGGLWNTFIDPGQIENALLNLAINARDAMDGQGKLTIELANAHLDDDYARRHDEVEPGQYVMLAVTDTGCGMSDEVMAKVFEPFFSTKAEGKGSGLGLSMVYGFVKQSGGHVNIYSEPGHGTTIRLYLPRAMEREDVEVMLDNGPITGGTETVLVVEDDDEVRATVVEMLGDLGYRVLKAVDAQSALNVVESGIPIDLLFTDVVMPGTLKSPELARKARERLPEIAVLFTSGYTENSIVHGGRLDAGVELLSKPYTREALARKVRHVLSNQGQRAKAAVPRVQPVVHRAAVKGAPRTILLVEDDALIRSATAEVLQEAGHVVVDAASAEEAMAALQTAPIDVLVTDVHLPGTSGLELASRAAELHPGIRIVVASGDVGAVKDAGRDLRLLTKPYGARDLLSVVADQPIRETEDG